MAKTFEVDSKNEEKKASSLIRNFIFIDNSVFSSWFMDSWLRTSDQTRSLLLHDLFTAAYLLVAVNIFFAYLLFNV